MPHRPAPLRPSSQLLADAVGRATAPSTEEQNPKIISGSREVKMCQTPSARNAVPNAIHPLVSSLSDSLPPAICPPQYPPQRVADMQATGPPLSQRRPKRSGRQWPFPLRVQYLRAGATALRRDEPLPGTTIRMSSENCLQTGVQAEQHSRVNAPSDGSGRLRRLEFFYARRLVDDDQKGVVGLRPLGRRGDHRASVPGASETGDAFFVVLGGDRGPVEVVFPVDDDDGVAELVRG